MYIWEANLDRYVDKATKFQTDTARANVFCAKRTPSALLVFTGEDAVNYFRSELRCDLRQAMAFGKALMSDGAFLQVDGRGVFENSATEYRFTWPTAEELAQKLLIQRAPEVQCAGCQNNTLENPDGEPAFTDDEFSIGSIGALSESAKGEAREESREAYKSGEQISLGASDDELWLSDRVTVSSSKDCNSIVSNLALAVTNVRSEDVFKSSEVHSGNDEYEISEGEIIAPKTAVNSLGALSHLRNKLNTAVKREVAGPQEDETRRRHWKSQGRFDALDCLEADNSAPESNKDCRAQQGKYMPETHVNLEGVNDGQYQPTTDFPPENRQKPEVGVERVYEAKETKNPTNQVENTKQREQTREETNPSIAGGRIPRLSSMAGPEVLEPGSIRRLIQVPSVKLRKSMHGLSLSSRRSRAVEISFEDDENGIDTDEGSGDEGVVSTQEPRSKFKDIMTRGNKQSHRSFSVSGNTQALRKKPEAPRVPISLRLRKMTSEASSQGSASPRSKPLRRLSEMKGRHSSKERIPASPVTPGSGRRKAAPLVPGIEM